MIGNTATGIFQGVYRRVVGEEQPELVDRISEQGDFPTGAYEDLIQAVEPAVRRSHQVINHGATTININVNGDGNAVSFNGDSKTYIWENVINCEVRLKLFSIGGYDSNSRLGKAFDFDIGRNISFELVSGADQASVEAVLASHRRYALRAFHGENDSAIALAYTSIEARDVRTKKIKVMQARESLDEIALRRP